MKTDFRILNVALGLLVLSALFFVIEHIFGKSRGKPLLRKGWLTDVCFWFLSPLVSKVLSRFTLIVPVLMLVALGLTTVAEMKAGKFHGFGPLSRQPLWLQVIEIFMLADFMGYWSHRLFHRSRWWPFHAVHHSSEELDWLSSVRVHPVNDMVSRFVEVTPLLLLGFNAYATAAVVPFFTFYAIFLHANVDWDFGPLRYVIATPVFHRWHHSKDRAAWDKNFAGLFVFWDVLFGTFYMPQGRKPEDFGIPETFPQDFVGQLVQPFARSFARKTKAS